MEDYKKIIGKFPLWREEKLRAIKRFAPAEVFFYRSTVWYHSLRVYFITRELSQIACNTIQNYDSDKAEILALIHDDAEMVTGDVSLASKDSMSNNELLEVHNNEANAIKALVEDEDTPITLSLGRLCYFYRDLLNWALHKNCVEAQVVSYADKLDAWCESLHDLFAGNFLTIRPVMNYSYRLKEFKTKYPLLEPLLNYREHPFTNTGLRLDPTRFYRKNYIHFGKPHSHESIKKDTEIIFYNLWRKLIVENLGEEGVRLLTLQKEFL